MSSSKESAGTIFRMSWVDISKASTFLQLSTSESQNLEEVEYLPPLWPFLPGSLLQMIFKSIAEEPDNAKKIDSSPYCLGPL